jgi:hypothetical protein
MSGDRRHAKHAGGVRSMVGLEPMLWAGWLYREDGLPRPEPLASLSLPWPNTAGVRIDKLDNLEVRPLVEPKVVAEVLLKERFVDLLGSNFKPLDEAAIPLARTNDRTRRLYSLTAK